MIKRSFAGGVNPDPKKSATRYLSIEDFPAPEKVFLPLTQQGGEPSIPMVGKGDKVLLGQKIAESGGAGSSSIYATVSGAIEDIKPILHPKGRMVDTIIIKNDKTDKKVASVKGGIKLEKTSPERIAKIIKEAGIVNARGVTPTKLSAAVKSDIEYVIVNGAESEPYLTGAHRVMLETPEKIIKGAKVIMRALGAKKVLVAIEENKKDAITVMKVLEKNDEDIEVVLLHTKYPQGAEKQLVKAALGREVPSKKSPEDVGVSVNNIDTCCDIASVIDEGMPPISRVITVSGGAIKQPRNYRVRIGTMVSEIIKESGGYSEKPEKLILGGAMTGMALKSEEVPIIRNTSAILALTKDEAKGERTTPCLRCGKCVEVCPMRLQPLMLMKSAKLKDWESCKKFNLEDCMECGACTYICPARQHPVQHIRLAKSKVGNKNKGEKK